ncbi:MAG TPA: FAD-dependent oxidoreductase [Stellaceae bacterium]|nr:FAD-dependent oxidoreductase [Stellaceae bacterium]
MPEIAPAVSADVLIVGSGSAGLAAALRAAVGGLKVIVLEKSRWIGGTSAMSGAGTWIPANHHARAAGIADSSDEALAYLRAASPADWRVDEDDLWSAFAETAPRMLEFLEHYTPLRFALTHEPDIKAELEGGKSFGRMLSPLPLSRRIVGPYAKLIRRSTLPHLFSYPEVYDFDAYHRPISAVLRLVPQLLWRLLTDSRGQGNALITGLLRGCLDHGCRIETSARVVELTVDPRDGGIVGLVVEREGRKISYRASRGVVLASGGFEWSQKMRERNFPGPLDRIGSPRTNEGDGQRMALTVGAKLARLDQANIYPTLPTRYEGHLHALPVVFQAEPHAIVVDRHGRRFVSEYDFNIGVKIDERDPETGAPAHLPVWVIADRRFPARSLVFRWYARKDRAWLIRAPTLAELASRIGVPSDALAETVARFNSFCAGGRDLDFHRGEGAWESFKAGTPGAALGTVEQAPFYAVPLNRSILGTKGGARTDAKGQVLRPDGSVISGLFAAGLAMANPIGTRAVGPGTTIGPNLTWGFICSETMLARNV